MTSRRKIYEMALEKWGRNAQLLMLAEEMGELLQAVSKSERSWSCETRNKLIEEIADTELMLDQLKYMHTIADTDIAIWKRKKLNRLEKILTTAKAGNTK